MAPRRSRTGRCRGCCRSFRSDHVKRPPSCLSELRFAALLQYSPDGQTAISEQSREHTRQIKRGSPAHIERIGLRCEEWAAKTQLAAFFGETITLVPVPRSKPFKDSS